MRQNYDILLTLLNKSHLIQDNNSESYGTVVFHINKIVIYVLSHISPSCRVYNDIAGSFSDPHRQHLQDFITFYSVQMHFTCRVVVDVDET